MSQIDDLIALVRARAEELSAGEDTRPELSAFLVEAIGKAMIEIRYGANSEEFKELTVIYFIELGDAAGYSADDLRSYLQDIKVGDPDEADEL